jgi:hypothetical protein
LDDQPVPGRLDNEIFTADFGNAPNDRMAYCLSQSKAVDVSLLRRMQDGVPGARAPGSNVVKVRKAIVHDGESPLICTLHDFGHHLPRDLTAVSPEGSAVKTSVC